MRWGLEKRLQFIEFRTYWEGGINRADIIGQFGVSVPQASKDLNLYQEKVPGNLVYDKSQKRYCGAADFKPAFLQPLVQLISGTASSRLRIRWCYAGVLAVVRARIRRDADSPAQN